MCTSDTSAAIIITLSSNIFCLEEFISTINTKYFSRPLKPAMWPHVVWHALTFYAIGRRFLYTISVHLQTRNVMWRIVVFGSEADEIFFFFCDKARCHWLEVVRSFEGTWWSHLHSSNVVWDSDISQRFCWSLNSSVIWSCVIVLFPQVR